MNKTLGYPYYGNCDICALNKDHLNLYPTKKSTQNKNSIKYNGFIFLFSVKSSVSSLNISYLIQFYDYGEPIQTQNILKVLYVR